MSDQLRLPPQALVLLRDGSRPAPTPVRHDRRPAAQLVTAELRRPVVLPAAPRGVTVVWGVLTAVAALVSLACTALFIAIFVTEGRVVDERTSRGEAALWTGIFLALAIVLGIRAVRRLRRPA